MQEHIKAEFLDKLRQNPDDVTRILLSDLRNALSTVISGDDMATANDVSRIVLEYAERMQLMLDALQEFREIHPG